MSRPSLAPLRLTKGENSAHTRPRVIEGSLPFAHFASDPRPRATFFRPMDSLGQDSRRSESREIFFFETPAHPNNPTNLKSRPLGMMMRGLSRKPSLFFERAKSGRFLPPEQHNGAAPKAGIIHHHDSFRTATFLNLPHTLCEEKHFCPFRECKSPPMLNEHCICN